MSCRRLPILLILLALMPIRPAQAQAATTGGKSSSIEVLGFYSFSAAADRYMGFIRETIAFHDPANFSEKDKALFRRLGRGDALKPFTDEDRQEWEDHLRDHMTDAAVFEVLVSDPDPAFDVGQFVQPDPSQPKHLWQVAWNEKFLSSDGERVLQVEHGKLPDSAPFRVVFVIHFWKPNLPLQSGDGELRLPPIQPMPDRLWRLTPYELPG